jgi:hypothetical protein
MPFLGCLNAYPGLNIDVLEKLAKNFPRLETRRTSCIGFVQSRTIALLRMGVRYYSETV